MYFFPLEIPLFTWLVAVFSPASKTLSTLVVPVLAILLDTFTADPAPFNPTRLPITYVT